MGVTLYRELDFIERVLLPAADVRLTTLAEAAAICDEVGQHYGDLTRSGCVACANEIRALYTAPQPYPIPPPPFTGR